MKKGIVSVFLAICMMFTSLFSFSFGMKTVRADEGEDLEVKKIVSVVYDNSGSMKDEDRWAYANYAMRMFASLMNEADELYITYMSLKGTITEFTNTVDVTPDNLEQTVNEILSTALNIKHVGSGTPFRAVEDAYAVLEKRASETEESAQYWLVVLTDGEFEGYDEVKLQEALEDKTKGAFAPGVIYLGMGKAAFSLSPKVEKSFYAYKASSPSEIASAMTEISNSMSGKKSVNQNLSWSADRKTLTVQAPYAMRDFSVLLQKSSSTVASATVNEDGKNRNIVVSKGISIIPPEGFNDLTGGVFRLGEKNEILPAGTYTITFDKTVSASATIDITIAPAFELKAKYFVNGKEMTEEEVTHASIYSGDTFRVETTVYEQGSGKVITSNVKKEITFTKDGESVSAQNGSLTLEGGQYLVTMTGEVDGFGLVPLRLAFNVKEVNFIVVGSVNGDSAVRWDKLSDTTIEFTIYEQNKNGSRVQITDEATIKELMPKITVAPEIGNTYDTKIENGKIIVNPKECTLTDPSGRVKVEVSCSLLDRIDSNTVEYQVILPVYGMSAEDGGSLKKTEFYGNVDEKVTFSFERDGGAFAPYDAWGWAQKIESGENEFSINDKKYAVKNVEDNKIYLEAGGNLPSVVMEVSEDGKITCTPYEEGDPKVRSFDPIGYLSFGRMNNYTTAYGKDMEFQFKTDYGMKTATIQAGAFEFEYFMVFYIFPILIDALILLELLNLLIGGISYVFCKKRVISFGYFSGISEQDEYFYNVSVNQKKETMFSVSQFLIPTVFTLGIFGCPICKVFKRGGGMFIGVKWKIRDQSIQVFNGSRADKKKWKKYESQPSGLRGRDLGREMNVIKARTSDSPRIRANSFPRVRDTKKASTILFPKDSVFYAYDVSNTFLDDDRRFPQGASLMVYFIRR